MRLATVFALFGLVGSAAPAWAQVPAGAEAAPEPASTAQVRVTTRILIIDRDAFSRAGLSYAVIGGDRVRVTSTGRRPSGGVRVKVGTHGVAAFLEAVRASRWIRSESSQQVLTLSGRPAVVSSQDLSVQRHAARTRGPSLMVIPTVLGDGTVHLQVSTGVEDRVSYAWGQGVDGSPAAVESELIARAGEEVILASSSSVVRTREGGLLGWGSSEEGRDVLVAVSADVVSP